MDSTILHVPLGDGSEGGIPIDMDRWAQLEARIQEVATATPIKAPELLATFNRAALELGELGQKLELQAQKATRICERIRGEILLDRVPKILAEKKLVTNRNPMGSDDLREAILSQQQDYQDALDREALLKAARKLIKEKQDAFQRAFYSIKAMIGEQDFNYTDSLHSKLGSEEIGIQGFGKPRY